MLTGESEPAFIGRHAPVLATEIPEATAQVVPDAGHASNLDNPAFFTAALREFLASLGTDGGDPVSV